MPGREMSRSERDEFGRIVARMAVTQICESVGFQSFQASAIETLADIAIRYLRDLAKAAHYYSNLSSRVESNAFDVILAMEDVGPVGVVGEAQRPISRSGALREVMRYVEYSEEMPFGRPLPRFPVSKKRLAAPSFAQLGEAPPGSHIPLWLPALPDPHTYRSTAVWPERKREQAANRLEQARQRRKAETTLAALHSRLAVSMGLVKEKKQQLHSDDQQAEMDVVDNPFLFPALEPGAKEVSKEGIPSIVEAFQTVVESGVDANGLELQEGTTNNNSSLAIEESGGGQKRPLPESGSRSRVVLSFDFGGKLGGKEALAHKILGVDIKLKKQKVAAAKDEDTDERKRRAEQILAQAIDHLAA